MSQNRQEWISRGKDASPEETVSKILGLLERVGIETEYMEAPQSLQSCYSSRVTIKGPLGKYIGSNGKGLSSALTKASAYGELMERLQNITFTCSPSKCDPRFSILFGEGKQGYYHLRGNDQPDYVKALKEKLVRSVPETIPAFMRQEVVDSLLEEIFPNADKGGFINYPFYSLRKNKYVYIPKIFTDLFTLSNGMAAGNTLEEAIVQASSEIFERYSEIFFIQGTTTPPDIPWEIIENYPSVSKIIDSIQADGRYRVTVKDCSMGKELPVVCGIISDTKSQTSGIKFGAYPDMCVALERVFSESMQGYTLEEFSRNGKPLFEHNSSRLNTWNLIKTGIGDLPVALLKSKADYPFKEWPSVKGLSNRQLMERMLNKMEELGADVYIEDVSFLGFPSVCIYAAGLSEVLPVDFTRLKEAKLEGEVIEIFHQEGPFTPEQLEKIIFLAKLKMFSSLENKYDIMTGVLLEDSIPGSPYEAVFMAAICNYALGNGREAIKLLSALVDSHKNSKDETFIYYRTLLMAMKAIVAGTDKEELLALLEKMSPAPVVKKVLSQLEGDPASVPEKVFIRCPSFHCENCHVKGCLYPQLFDFHLKLVTLREQNPVDPQALENLLAPLKGGKEENE